MHRILAVKGIVKRCQPLLPVKDQLVRLSVRIRVRSFDRFMFEMDAFISIFQKHRCTDRKVMYYTEYQSLNSSIIPYPPSLEIRQLSRAIIHSFH